LRRGPFGADFHWRGGIAIIPYNVRLLRAGTEISDHRPGNRTVLAGRQHIRPSHDVFEAESGGSWGVAAHPASRFHHGSRSCSLRLYAIRMRRFTSERQASRSEWTSDKTSSKRFQIADFVYAGRAANQGTAIGGRAFARQRTLGVLNHLYHDIGSGSGSGLWQREPLRLVGPGLGLILSFRLGLLEAFAGLDRTEGSACGFSLPTQSRPHMARPESVRERDLLAAKHPPHAVRITETLMQK
jgi:hypothetical protein